MKKNDNPTPFCPKCDKVFRQQDHHENEYCVCMYCAEIIVFDGVRFKSAKSTQLPNHVLTNILSTQRAARNVIAQSK